MTDAEHPPTTHRHALALIKYYRHGDHDAYLHLLSELADPDDATRTIMALVRLANLILDEHPDDAERWIDNALLLLAQADDTDPDL